MKFRLTLAICTIIVVMAIISSCQNETDLNFKRYYSAGQVMYQSHCQNCHGAGGEGLGQLMPPLTDSASLKKHLHQLPCFVKYGLQTPATVNGKVYTQPMPAQTDLTPVEIAEILTYVTNSFGNKLGVFEGEQVEKDLTSCTLNK